MPLGAEVQELLVRLGLDDSQYQAGLKRVEASSLGLQRQAATLKAYAAEQAALAGSIAKRQAGVLGGLPAITRGYSAAAREASRLIDDVGRYAAAERTAEKAASSRLSTNRRAMAQYATQGLANLEREAARVAAYEASQARLGQQALTRRASLSKQAWATEVAGINAAAAAQARYNEIAASQTVGARFNKGLTAPTGRLAKIGVAAAGGGLKFLERSFLVTAAAGVVLESQFFKVQDAQAALARTLAGESAPAVAALSQDILEMSRVIPLATTELYRIAEVIGTTNVAADSIAGLTAVVAKLASTTDLSADEAAIGMARLLNMFGQIDEKGHIAAGAAESLADAIFRASLRFASSDQEILRASLRFGALANMMHMTQGQVIALSGAVTGLGQEPEAVGGSFQRLFQIINKAVGEADKLGKVTPALAEMAKLANLTPAAFSEGVKAAPFETFIKLVEGFSKLSPTEQSVLFGKGGIFPSFVRGAQTLQNLGLSYEEVLKAAKEFDTNSGQFDKAFATRVDTLQKNLRLLGNAAIEAGFTFGDAFDEEMGGAIKKLTTYIIDSLPAIEKFGQQVGRIIGGIDWGKAKTYADAFFGTIKKGFDIVASLPPELLAVLGAFKAFNFLSGGALGTITGSFASGIGGIFKNVLVNALSQVGLGKFFVQPVFVTNPGFGLMSFGKTGLISVAVRSFLGVAAMSAFLGFLANSSNVPGQGGTPSNVKDNAYRISEIQRTIDALKRRDPNELLVPGYSKSTETVAQAIDRLEATIKAINEGGGTGVPGFGEMYGPSLSQLGAIPRMGDLQKETNAILNRGANSQETAVSLLQKLLDALKPRHRQGEKGKSIQSAEFAAINRLDPSRTGDINAYLADLIEHYTKKPIGTKGHERGFIMPAFKGIFPELKADLKAAMKTGGPGLDKMIANLQGLKHLGVHLPVGLRNLLKRAAEAQKSAKETGKETKDATRGVKSAVTDASDRIENLTAALRRKQLAVTVKPSWKANVKAPSVRVNPKVTVTIGARSITRYYRGTVAYGPGYVLMQTGTGGAAVYSGGGGY